MVVIYCSVIDGPCYSDDSMHSFRFDQSGIIVEILKNIPQLLGCTWDVIFKQPRRNACLRLNRWFKKRENCDQDEDRNANPGNKFLVYICGHRVTSYTWQ